MEKSHHKEPEKKSDPMFDMMVLARARLSNLRSEIKELAKAMQQLNATASQLSQRITLTQKELDNRAAAYTELASFSGLEEEFPSNINLDEPDKTPDNGESKSDDGE